VWNGDHHREKNDAEQLQHIPENGLVQLNERHRVIPNAIFELNVEVESAILIKANGTMHLTIVAIIPLKK
jgi:hypothetical protein